MATQAEIQKRIERKKGRLAYLASLLRATESVALKQIADLLVTLTDGEVVRVVDKLRLWLV